MKTHHPVSVQRAAFLFCRVSITVILWAAFFLHSIVVLWLAFILLGLSAVLGVDRAPMIVLYTQTVGRFLPSFTETLDRSAMRFAHTLGTLWSGACLFCLYVFPLSPIGWRLLLLLSIMKTISASGYCPASKLYTCATGGCCPLSRRLFGEQHHD
ncbi:MAG TPA: hypothetical protein DEB30_05315 [Candidatus Peribacter riflensis]|uniref:DUF4395 domain-containing protein n=1 Tax=Candidatus Peribacter riflensis TaxID=1735162 RepID=A0A0S1SU21_9BACT|nr:MAG: hypothetical protein PeribacterA2_0132 [Candidatus Peribacter riflensis]OGJ76707.1 MAG: hypothetical protein A2398_03710 [Candidatus Peribacteria bacterium RIFOXYB1_FULL_57_12]OGJ82062.1 MAG: hypothetical protein A2412_05130 [Candidatus Peribacteria bacterium RIFOXYC1_FULL_58_8]ALM10629.1 MAG: hypothetical protein PeribacterB2_0132 [Candidatus Peribacter riflensis]ALM11731.1 MAG: hypothetical protein PeribacterC2_0131 [Candidatus Peribacter riflensis]